MNTTAQTKTKNHEVNAMNPLKHVLVLLPRMLAVALSLALPTSSWANISNVASATYRDAANNSYSATSNTVVVVTPPVISSALTATGDVGVAFSYQITATNSPTSFGATGLPTGLTMNASGLITGTPTASGTTNVTISATNAAGTGTATLALTVRGSAVITLTKTASPMVAAVGATVTFSIQYQNTGAGAASNVVITDVIPAGSTFVAGSIVGGGTLTGSTITWTIPSVAAGASGTVSFRVTVN